jgi:FlaA1/EpsC-like NDP-sugar epimerase
MPKLNTSIKRVILIAFDFLSVPIAWLLAYWLRDNLSSISVSILLHASHYLPIVMLAQYAFFYVYGVHRGHWRFSSLSDLVKIVYASVTATLVIATLFYIVLSYLYPRDVLPPRSIFILYPLLQIFILGGARLAFRLYKEQLAKQDFSQRALIVGAGCAGEILCRELLRDVNKQFYPVGFIDDDASKVGTEIHGVRVLAQTSEILTVVKQYQVDQVFIAVPSAAAVFKQQLIDVCVQAKVACRTLPGLSEIAGGQVSVNMLREVSLEDLLGREPISYEDKSLLANIANKTVLVTGGGGSIGSELCLQIALLHPKKLVIIEHGEFNLYSIRQKLAQADIQCQLQTYLQTITDKVAIAKIFDIVKPDLVFHAAAYKHVPLLEYDPIAAVKNNVLGTKIVADAASEYGVDTFVLVSTDKAVNSTNVMGATKRCAELYCMAMNHQSSTQFKAVRFGNVLGSAGSVVPLFQQQIKAGGPITLTHKDITRYFMTIPEACQLILRSTFLGNGGEIYVLDMGQPVKILDLATKLIQLSGKEPEVDIKIQYVGLRPGEKLYEELFYDEEALQATTNQKIQQACVEPEALQTILVSINQLVDTLDTTKVSQLYDKLAKLLPQCKLQPINVD